MDHAEDGSATCLLRVIFCTCSRILDGERPQSGALTIHDMRQSAYAWGQWAHTSFMTCMTGLERAFRWLEAVQARQRQKNGNPTEPGAGAGRRVSGG